MANKINIKNKKASHDYEFIDKYTAGIILTGTEIKSIRTGKAGLTDTYCVFKNGELWVKNLYIAEYSHGGYTNHEPKRDRKLLLNKNELRKLDKKVKERGYTIVASGLFISERGLAKVNIALARGKKEYDKREDIKKKDIKRMHERLDKV
ncbi:MAG: SsrA-binding protein SmpB [Bacteroidales bacterium]|nr:SsrA-binding protein SmpB [Bacteroidales bacterium]